LRVEKDDAGGEQLADALEDFREAVEGGSFADVDDDGGALDFGGCTDEGGEVREQLEGQVVDGVVTDIFKGLEGRGLAGAGDSGDDDQFPGRLFQ
jgi:hypothetical protein